MPPAFEVGLREIFLFDCWGLVFGVRQVLIQQVVDSVFDLGVAELRTKRFVFKLLELSTGERILSLLYNLGDQGCILALRFIRTCLELLPVVRKFLSLSPKRRRLFLAGVGLRL